MRCVDDDVCDAVRGRNTDAAHGLKLLIAIADGGSFAAAGAQLGLTPSAVSKAVTRVEARRGVRLLQRTTRRVAFADAGEVYIARGRQLLADFEGLERETSSRDETMRGMLRVSAPTVYGAVSTPALHTCLARAPKTLDDLAAHALIAYSGASATLRCSRVVFATDNILAAHEAARGGLGIAELPDSRATT